LKVFFTVTSFGYHCFGNNPVA